MTKQNSPKLPPKAHKSEAFTFSDHIRELRRRVLWVALVFFATSSLAYNYHDLLVQIVMAPLRGEKLTYLTPGGGFSFIFQVTLYAGLIAAAPMLMYQLYGFVRPTLPQVGKRSAVKVAFLAILLMITGVTYGYFVAIPAALTFLSTFAGTQIVPNLTADSYLSFFLSYVGGLALLFQLPLLLIFWNWISPMKPGGLLKSERWMILFAFIAAALITPTPDVVNQSMIAVPLLAIYQIGVVTVLIINRSDRARQKITQSAALTPVEEIVASSPAPVVTTPAPLVAKKLTAAPISPVAPLQPMRPVRRRSIDGFSRSAGSLPKATPGRSLAIPARTVTRHPLMGARHAFRIDGMSPL